MSTILPDFLTRVRPTVDVTIQPVAPSKDVQEALSRLVSGQRVFAEILSVLPNGTYRAVVSQRDMVLALPFSAKSGDTLELQVVQNDGRTAFAVVAPKGETSATPAALTNLSPAGQLISQLIGRTPANPEHATPATLAAGKPLLSAPPAAAQALAPVLQQAIAESGLFYEAHQARWIDGRFPLSALTGEPQHMLTRGASTAPPEIAAQAATTGRAAATSAPAGQPQLQPGSLPGAAAQGESPAIGAASTEPRAAAALNLPREITPLVQQQLQSLETGVYLWHGQVWPGQTMEWEIIDQDARRQSGGEANDDGIWRSRLRLRFPGLGAVAAEIQLRGDRLEVALTAADARDLLTSGLADLQSQFDGAGLKLARITINDHGRDT